jgi:vancomycin resistance protein YoaR
MKPSGKRILVGLGAVAAGCAVGFSIMAARYEPVIRPNTMLGEVAVGGLTPEAAAKRLRLWWEMEKGRQLTFTSDVLKKLPPPKRPGELGITLDDAESVKQLPMEGFGGYASRTLGASAPEQKVFPVKFKFVGSSFTALKTFVSENAGTAKAAKVSFVKGNIVREPEISGFALDEEALPEKLMEGIHGDGTVTLPVTEAPKKVPDAELEKIKDVVSEFSTNFSTGKVNRSSNIRLAASKLDGVILMPGETLSFNGTVGRRTVAGGFKEAGVYANGRHDTGIGGGICQVSTTLYNAAMFANLKVKQRSNHSMPVPYVPIGRDATVDYGSLDLLIENTLGMPIAVCSEYMPGKLTFRVLGIKDPTLKIKMVQENHTSWGTGVRTETDPSLPPGAKKVVEKGSSGHQVYTFRLIYKNGQLVERQPLGRSYYRGATRIIAVGPKAAEPAPPAPGGAPATIPPSTTPPPVDGPPPSNAG